ncbi:serine/threonine-protein kinase KIPK1-like isoform X3 [Varroa destructor]|nr:serine/threonine-protein kinase KIPK1-like isoform X3 [Varroa destructor]
MRRAFKLVAKRQKRLVKGTRDSFKMFLRHCSSQVTPRLLMTPMEYFLVEQVRLTAIAIYRRIMSQKLTFLDVREDLGNLMSLYDDTRSEHRQAAQTLAVYFHKLVLITAVLAGELEEASRVQRTNWYSVIDLLYSAENVISSPSSSKRLKVDERFGFRLDALEPLLVPRLDQITKLRLLGKGGFGSVYKVNIGGLTLTCKLIRQTRLHSERAKCADKLVATLVQSRLLVIVYACFKAEGAYVCLMEYLRGVDLYKAIRGQPRFSVELCRIILSQLCLAIQYLHVTGFIHRDIKPSNMIIMPNCRIRLIDFDTCKVCAVNASGGVNRSYIRKSFTEFHDGQTAGTLHYLAPEVLRGFQYGRAIDWWAVGVTAYLLATQTTPIRGKDARAVKQSITSDEKHINFAKIQESDLRHIISRWMTRDPYDRLTGVLLSDITTHPFFLGVDWKDMECGEGKLYTYSPILKLMKQHSDTSEYSPPSAAVPSYSRTRHRILDLDDILDSPAQIPLLTFVSHGMMRVLQKMERDETPCEADLNDQREITKMALTSTKKLDLNNSYRFKELLLAPRTRSHYYM